MLERTKSDMMQMKFYGMLATLDLRLGEATSAGWGHGEFIASVMADEKLYRDNIKIDRRLKAARFRVDASLEQFDTTGRRSISRTQIQDIATLRWLAEPRNILVFGPTGVGKTFLATAIGTHVCRQGHTCLFLGVNLLIEKLKMARQDGTFLRYRERLTKADLLILDDLGIKQLPPDTVQDLYDILEERYQSRSTIITTQLPITNWGEVIPDPVAMEAIVDRLIHGAIMLEIKGESYRRKRQPIGEIDSPKESQ